MWVLKKHLSETDSSFEHPRHKLCLHGMLSKKIISILGSNYLLNWTYDIKHYLIFYYQRSNKI